MIWQTSLGGASTHIFHTVFLCCANSDQFQQEMILLLSLVVQISLEVATHGSVQGQVE